MALSKQCKVSKKKSRDKFMELIIDVFNYALTAILIGVCGAWVFLIRSMVNSFRFTPYLDKFENTSKSYPKV